MRRRLLSHKDLWLDEFYLYVDDVDRDNTGHTTRYMDDYRGILLNGLNKHLYPDEEHFYAYDAGGDGYYGSKYISVVVGPKNITERNYVAIIHTYIASADIGDMGYLYLDGDGSYYENYENLIICLYSTSDPNSAYEMVYQNTPNTYGVWYPSEGNVYDVLCIVKNDFFKKYRNFYFTSAYFNKPPYNYNSLPTSAEIYLYEGTDDEVFNIRYSGSNRYVTTLKQNIGYFSVYSRWINHEDEQAPSQPTQKGGISFALQPQSVYNDSNKTSLMFTKEHFIPMFTNHFYGEPFFMFGVWKKSASSYTQSTSLWKMYMGQLVQSGGVGFFDNFYVSYTDISKYGIELLNGSSVDFADSIRDYGNITWINVATSGVHQGAFYFRLTEETINKIIVGLLDDTELVVGIHSNKSLFDFRSSKNDGLDGLPANGYRSDPNNGNSPWIYTACSGGPYVGGKTTYYTTTVGAIKTGTGCNAVFSLDG